MDELRESSFSRSCSKATVLLQQGHLLAKLGNLQRLRLDHLVALPQGCWLAKATVLLGSTIFFGTTVH